MKSNSITTGKIVILVFILSSFSFFGQELDSTKYYIIPQQYEGCNFSFCIPTSINDIDSTICKTYGKKNNQCRKYYFLVKQMLNGIPKVHLFYIADENGDMICIDDKLLHVKILNLIDNIILVGFSSECDVNLTIPLKVGALASE